MLTQMEVAFRFSEIAFFKEYFILASGNGFPINYKLCAFIRSFSLLWMQCFKLGVNAFSSIFLCLTAEAVFPASGNGYFIEWFMETDFLLRLLLLRPHVMLMETIIQIKVRPFFIEQPLSYYLKPSFTRSFRYFWL